MRTIGTRAFGVRTPIIREGDDLVTLVAESVKASADAENIALQDRDVVGITEAVVARAQGNYATIDQIAADVAQKFPEGEVGVILPIFSRNRFSMLLKGISKGVNKVYLQLGFPSDEVGNMLISLDDLDAKNVNPYTDSFTEKEFVALFGNPVHQFTGVNYVEFYKSLGDNIEIVFSNNPTYILKYTKNALAADIHTRHRTKRLLKAAGANRVYGLDDILSSSVNGSGFNPDYGLLGSNKATEESVKLFPRDCKSFTDGLQKKLKELTGKSIEVMIYGDGAFKDPVGGIWELADPVVSPAYSDGLVGQPSELKLKFLADNQFSDLTGEKLEEALRKAILEKQGNMVGKMESEGTTPRRYTDLLGSLCDLVSGSGDKGTPVVVVQGYFDNYAL